MTKVIVAGGGIGGISAALSMLKAGLDVEVYEQASELMEIGLAASRATGAWWSGDSREPRRKHNAQTS